MRRNIIPVGTVLQVRTVSVTVTSKCKVVRIYRYTGILDSSLVHYCIVNRLVSSTVQYVLSALEI